MGPFPDLAGNGEEEGTDSSPLAGAYQFEKRTQWFAPSIIGETAKLTVKSDKVGKPFFQRHQEGSGGAISSGEPEHQQQATGYSPATIAAVSQGISVA